MYTTFVMFRFLVSMFRLWLQECISDLRFVSIYPITSKDAIRAPKSRAFDSHSVTLAIWARKRVSWIWERDTPESTAAMQADKEILLLLLYPAIV